MHTRHPANSRRALPALFYAAGLGLAGAFAHADELDPDVPKLHALPSGAYEPSSGTDPTAGATALAGTGGLDTALADTDAFNTAALAAALARSIAQMTPEEFQSFRQTLNRRTSERLQLSVSVKDNDATCFLREAEWASCFEDLPEEPEWDTKNVPELPPPNFWQLRSLWTKTPVERLE